MRHSVNKPLANQASYITQDRFITHMRLYRAFNNIRVWQKLVMQPDDAKPHSEFGHFLLPRFLHQSVVRHCERQSCRCRAPRRSQMVQMPVVGVIVVLRALVSVVRARGAESAGVRDLGRGDWGDEGSDGGIWRGERSGAPVTVEGVQPPMVAYP
eukprot:TRINITY_DN12837_c0_g1_i1.p1 TRINITY_DN12837_c0_g1~~TRINITY_DN12837_c0_g1_i1.p1  ORF type:complete len:162 (-),score=9.62 TRINITY_DN12837_c0_g1_i1:26-490(-)